MRICIVTTAHVTDNPRVVKEADALAEAGHDVRVVAYDRWPQVADLDRELVASRRWRLIAVRVRPDAKTGFRWLSWNLLGRVAEQAYARGAQVAPVRDLALSRYHRTLFSAAVAEPADLVIAHHAPALPAAAAAARRLNAALGYDAEDLHAEDYSDPVAERVRLQLVSAVEAAYLPRCRTLTASSAPIAEALVARYGVRRPHVVLNTFPLADRAESGEAISGSRHVPSMYWYSQMIGHRRGLEDVLEAMSLLDQPVELHLRGTLDPAFAVTLQEWIARYDLHDRVKVWPRAKPADLVRLAAAHDIGLALEHPVSPNRAMCVTNKLLVYLLAGLAVAATDTEGQRSVLSAAPGAGFLYTPGDARALAHGLNQLLRDPDALAAAKSASLRAARQRYSWEHDREPLVQYLTRGADRAEPLRAATLVSA